MAADNKTLGRFILDGIPPAPRGVPQIEVTFDIDANGIVHVSAKDLGTGKEQKITITATTHLSEDEIQRAIKDAEKYAEEDKKRRQLVEAKNNADSLIYNTEKTMREMGDKISKEDKDRIQKEIEATRKAIESNDIDKIKAATEKLTQVSYEIFGRIYQQQARASGGASGQDAPGKGKRAKDDDVVDADYEVMDDNK
jgi:molecular chaperone DnaK